MLTNLFESRNKTFLNLVKLGDYLGRSLRENVELFSVDNDSVTYLTESGHVVRGNFDKTALKLTNIKVVDANVFKDKDTYSKLVENKISNFLADILESDLDKVGDSFESILNSWESRLHFDRIEKRLQDKCEKFNENLKIISSPEFERLKEVKNDLIKLLKESTNFIDIPEIRNTIKLSSVISKSFNIPKITLQNLSEATKFQVPNNVNHTLYDHLCKQELIAKEFLEAKNNIDQLWVTNEKIQKLPSFIYESNENVMQLVAEIVSELPYFAMSTKKQITYLVENNLDLLSERNLVSSNDIKEFVAKIFEFKKPVKNHLLTILNEKYGINIQNLTDEPTFNSLIKTQIVIFESLAKLSPKNSLLRKTLQEFSESLKIKSGVESIDVTDFLNEVFEESEYTSIINETSLMSYLNFDKVADDLGKIGQVLKMIQSNMGGAAMGGAPTDMAAQKGELPQGAMQMAQQPVDGEGDYETDGGPLAGMGDEADMESEHTPVPAMDAEDAASEVSAEDAMQQDGEEEEEGEDGEVEFVEKDELIDNLKNLEMLIADLKTDMGLEGEEGEGSEDGEMMDAEFSDPDEEGESEEGSEFGGEAESEGDGGGEDEAPSDEEESDEEEEEAPPPSKKEKKGKPNFNK